MYTYNTTFVVAPDKEAELLQYIRREILSKLFNEDSPAKNPDLKKIIEAGGEKRGPEHGVSIALAASFPSEETAHLWNDHFLLPALQSFHTKFGDQAVFFVTLLEHLYI